MRVPFGFDWTIEVLTVEPDSMELAILKRHYPHADPANPPWQDIKIGLLAAGVNRYTIRGATSRELVRLLGGQRQAVQSRIPPERRSKPLTLSKAAKLMGYIGDNSTIAERLRKHLKDNGSMYEQVNRQTYIFDVADFPANVQDKLLPG